MCFMFLVPLKIYSGVFPGVMTDDDFKKLDTMAQVVGRMVSGAERNFAPIETWTPEFKE